MEAGEKLPVKCNKCGNIFHCQAPSLPGNYSVTCSNPECGAKVSFRFPLISEADNKQSHPAFEIKFGLLENGNYRFRCENKTCNQSVIVPSNMVKTGHNKAVCPKCHSIHEFDIEATEDDLLKCQTTDCDFILTKPERGDGLFSCLCEKCGQEYSLLIKEGKVVKVTMKTPAPLPPKKQLMMKLVLGRFLGKKEYPLSKGIHYVGRIDDANSSDLSLKDKYVSTRSVRIDVNENGGLLVYRLTVERAMNPVYHNSRELSVGDVVYLTYGDTLKLGKTLIKVQKIKE